MTDEVTFERDLRAMLAARDLGPAPSTLAARVQGARTLDRRPSILVRLARPFAAVALVAAVLAVAIIASRPIVGPGATVAPDPTAPYAIRAGDGVVFDAAQAIAQELIGLVFGAALFVTARISRDRRVRIAAMLAGLGLALVAINIGSSDAIALAGRSGVTPTRPATDDETGAVLAVTGDGRFTVMEGLRNESRLPLSILGIAGGGSAEVGGYPGLGNDMVTLPRWVGAGRLLGSVFAESEVLPFQPYVLGPGAEANLVIAGLAGTCASPRPVGATGANGGSYVLDRVDLVYEQLTIVHTQTLILTQPITIPIGPPCT